jgi:DUF971 family protein
MIEIRAQSNVQLLSRALRELGEAKLPKALARASTLTAYKVRDEIADKMASEFDRPTPVTLKSLFIKAAKPKGNAARVWFKDSFNSGIPADKYLQPQVQGGARGHKRFEKALIAKGLIGSGEYAIPTRDVMNAFGNVPGALSVKILSGLGAAETTSGVTANASGSRRSKKKGNARRYFIAKIKNTKAIWEAKQTAFGRAIRPMFIIVNKAPTYSKRLEFFKIAEEVVQREYLGQFSQAIDDVIDWGRS